MVVINKVKDQPEQGCCVPLRKRYSRYCRWLGCGKCWGFRLSPKPFALAPPASTISHW